MSIVPVTLLVVAKAPVPGQAKTRLAATVGDRVAAQIAAAALLDTLDAVRPRRSPRGWWRSPASSTPPPTPPRYGAGSRRLP